MKLPNENNLSAEHFAKAERLVIDATAHELETIRRAHSRELADVRGRLADRGAFYSSARIAVESEVCERLLESVADVLAKAWTPLLQKAPTKQRGHMADLASTSIALAISREAAELEGAYLVGASMNPRVAAGQREAILSRFKATAERVVAAASARLELVQTEERSNWWREIATGAIGEALGSMLVKALFGVAIALLALLAWCRGS